MRQRFRDQILHDVAHGLIPRAVDEALRERGVEPVDTPDIKDVVVEEGQPLKFTATSRPCRRSIPATTPAITLRQPPDTSVEDAPSSRRCRSCASAPRATSRSRGAASRPATRCCWISSAPPTAREPASAQTDKHEGSPSTSARAANPPGFDEALVGLNAGDRKTFDMSYPDDYAIQELAGTR